MKKIISITLALFFVLSFAVLAYAYDNFVDDSAMLFSSDETSEITDCVESFSLETGYSLAVVTTDDSMGKSSDEYADDYLDDLIDNQCWSEDSMLFLIDMDNREIYISTTGSAMDSYDSFQIDNIIDSGYSELVQGNYARAVILMTETAEGIYNESNDENYDNIYGYIGSYEDYGYNEYDYDYYDYVDNNRSGFSVDFTDILVYIIVGIGAAGITVLIVKSKYKNHGKDDMFDTDDISLDITGSTDNVISRNVVTTRIPKNNNHGKHGGGFSGGGSVHRSSGGRMHGGGGRKF
ncbi:MAG: TPM domain-containing protein [Ruminococcaceae bacterium]|nr:TPM domain-containing protein [Oscillospiraceae bacterium]